MFFGVPNKSLLWSRITTIKTNNPNELLLSLKPSWLSSGCNTTHLVHLSHLVLVYESFGALDNVVHLAVILNSLGHLSHTFLNSQSTQEVALQ